MSLHLHFHEYQKILEPNLLSNVLLTKAAEVAQETKQQILGWELIMDAKWNKIIDNLSVRTTLLIVGFGAWLAIGYSLLAL